MKYNQTPPPHFPKPTDNFSIDYRNHDGRIMLGMGDWLFETKWSKSGSGSIYVVNDPPGIKGVAVAPHCSKIEEVDEKVFAMANFTSRSRQPAKGQVVLIENIAGYVAAVELLEITVAPEGMPGTAVVGRYKILTDRSRDFSIAREDRYPSIRGTVNEALKALEQLEPVPSTENEDSHIGIGHNAPPQEYALNPAEFADTIGALKQLDLEAEKKLLTPSTVRSTGEKLGVAIKKIAGWLGDMFKLVEEGFLNQIGASIALGVVGLGIWAIAAEKLNAAYLVIQNFLR